MNKILVILAFLLIWFPNNVFSKNTLIENEIKDIERNLYQVEKEIKNNDKVLSQLKILMITVYVKMMITRSNFFSLDNESKYHALREKYELYRILYNNLKNRIAKKERELKEIKKDYQSKLENLSKKRRLYAEQILSKEEHINFNQTQKSPSTFIFDPITGKASSPGKYSTKVPPGTEIKAPIGGIVKKINFTLDTFTVVLENPNCFARVSGLSILRVSLGEEIKARQTIGESGFSEGENNLFFEVSCSK